MSRLFDGVDDDVHTAIGGNNFNTAVTMAFLCKMGASRDSNWNALMTCLNSGAGAQGHGMMRVNSNKVGWLNDGGFGSASTTTTTSTDGWCLHIATKAAGNTTPRYHRYKFGTGWQHENMDSAMVAPTAPGATGGVELGGDVGGSGDWFAGRLVVAAIWNSVLDDTACEALISGFTRASWLLTSPSGLWDELDAFNTDHTGNGAARTSLVGTTDDADDPTGWESWDAAAPVEVDYRLFPKPKLRELVNR